MDLRFLNRMVALSQASQAATRRRGTTTQGHKLWTGAEDDILRKSYPNYQAMKQAMPHRTRIAIWSRCREIGLKRTRHRWLAIEISKLRKLYPSSPRSVICNEFPDVSWVNIRKAATYYGLRRNPRKHRRTGKPVIDIILSRIEEIEWTLADLDAESGTGNYFRRHYWRRHRLNFNAIAKAVRALDGDLEISWKQYA